MRWFRVLGVALALGIGTACSASAATTFSEDFSSNTLGTNMVVTDDQGSAGNIDTTGGNVLFPGSGDGGRAYVGTADVDYNTVDFTAEVTLTTAAAGQAWFGLGAGGTATLGSGGDSFGEPGEGPVTYIRHLAVSGNLTLGGNPENVSGLTELVNDPGATPLGVAAYQLRLEYTAGTGTAKYFVDDVQFGPDVDVSTYDFSGKGHVFFGGSEGTIMDDFSVVAIPEPASIVLVSLGLIGLLGRRRRRT